MITGRRPLVVYALSIVAVALLYFASAKAGLSLAFENTSATAVWAPTGIALAAVFLYGYRIWPGVALGAFLANITTQGSLATVLGITTGNTAEALVGAYFLHRVGFRPSIQRTRDVRPRGARSLRQHDGVGDYRRDEPVAG